MARGLSRAERSFFAMAREQRTQRKVTAMRTTGSRNIDIRAKNKRARSVLNRQLQKARATMARYGVKASTGHSGG